MNIIVTGGCGYKGSILVEELLSYNFSVTIIDACWFGNYLLPHPNLKIIQKDTRNLTDEDVQGDAIIHLAAVASDPSAVIGTKLSWEVNVLATQQLLEICKRNKIPRFIFASSGSVYGVRPEERVIETLPLVPISDYNKTKMVGERVVLSYADDINVTIIRPATICGLSPRMRFDLAVNALTIDALEKGVITVHGGDQCRPNTHIKDIANSYIWALEHPDIASGQIYNVGFENRSLRDLAIEIKDTVETRLAKKVDINFEKMVDPRSYRVCSDKILTAGFKPQFTIHDAITDIVDQFCYNGLRKLDEHNNALWMTKCQIS
jgi:nucleoside-diphosphate-sugar epimerase